MAMPKLKRYSEEQEQMREEKTKKEAFNGLERSRRGCIPHNNPATTDALRAPLSGLSFCGAKIGESQ